MIPRLHDALLAIIEGRESVLFAAGQSVDPITGHYRHILIGVFEQKHGELIENISEILRK